MFSLSVEQINDYLSRRFVVNVWLPVFFFAVAGMGVAVLAMGIEEAVASWNGLTPLTSLWLPLGALLLITLAAYVCDNLLDTIVRFYEGYWPAWAQPIANLALREQQRRWQHLNDRLDLIEPRLANIRAARRVIAQEVTPSPTSLGWAELRKRVEQFEQPLDQMLKQKEWATLLADFQTLRADILEPADSPQAERRREQEAQLKENFLSLCEQELVRLRMRKNADYATLYFTFPKKEALLLPTRLGNILRAAEEHSQWAYNLDASTVWPRLVLHLPEELQNRLAQSSTPLTTMLLSSMLSFLFAVIGGTLLFLTHHWLLLSGVVIAGVLLSIWFYESALQRAIEYGILIRITFDLYRHELLKALGEPLPSSLPDERKRWQELWEWWYLHRPPIDTSEQ